MSTCPSIKDNIVAKLTTNGDTSDVSLPRSFSSQKTYIRILQEGAIGMFAYLVMSQGCGIVPCLGSR